MDNLYAGRQKKKKRRETPALQVAGVATCVVVHEVEEKKLSHDYNLHAQVHDCTCKLDSNRPTSQGLFTLDFRFQDCAGNKSARSDLCCTRFTTH